jgi:D-beta-D-heptose 7-phosphate kinase/D-beta-D-heptose 1-phosphate adenosyltransferase
VDNTEVKMFSRQRLEEIIAGMAGRRIMVIGDVMVDQFIRGAVERISPEAPVPVVQVQKEQSLPGGAANVVRNLAAMGVRPEIVSVIGRDREGEVLASMLSAMGCSDGYLVRDDQRRTSVKTRVVAQHQQVVRFDRETLDPLDGVTIGQLQEYIRGLLVNVDGVIVSDYGKGVINKPVFDDLVEGCQAAGVFLAVDPKVKNFYFYHDLDLITPNTMEASQACGFSLDTPAAVKKSGIFIKQHFRSTSVIVTRGEEGMAIFPPAGDMLLLPTLAKEVFDVTGAGDTVIALATAAALVPGVSLAEAAGVANLAAGVAVGKLGTARVAPGEIVDYHQKLMAS